MSIDAIDYGYDVFSASTIDAFKTLFTGHGALGKASYEQWSCAVNFTENQKRQILPLVFGLIPPNLFQIPTSPYRAVKPEIVKHLNNLGLDSNDNDLVEIIKKISDQYYFCISDQQRSSQRKGRISTLKSDANLYKKVLSRQNHRCSFCGVLFDNIVLETLDHIIPYKLLGDPPEADNWQILCKPCNSGKKEYISNLQSPQAWNWIYNSNEINSPIAEDLRYVVLSSSLKCSVPGCSAKKHNEQLIVTRKEKNSLPVLWNVAVYCRAHLPD